jgi:hypothetical protein
MGEKKAQILQVYSAKAAFLYFFIRPINGTAMNLIFHYLSLPLASANGIQMI